MPRIASFWPTFTADRLRHAGLAAALIAALTLAGAWFFQLVLDIRPCPLCLEQRYAYYAAIPVGLAAALIARRMPVAAIVLLIAIALAMFVNAVLGGYHAGVEWGFWPGPSDCTGPIADFSKSGSLLDQLDSVKVIRCDEVQWRFLGLSLAGYNVLISLAIATIAIAGFAHPGRRR